MENKEEKETLLEISRQNGIVDMHMTTDPEDRMKVCILWCCLLLHDKRIMEDMNKAAEIAASLSEEKIQEMFAKIEEED